MTSLEDQLRQSLADHKRALPGWTDPVAQVSEGIMRRRRRRRGAVLLGAAISVLLLALAPLALRPALSPDPVPDIAAGEVVPWLDEPAPQPTYLARIAPPAPTTSCTATAITGTGPNHGAWRESGPTASGFDRATVLVGNNDQRCTIAGSGVLTGVDPRTGERMPLAMRSGTSIDGGAKVYPATMDPGSPARIDIETSTSCRKPATPQYQDVRLEALGAVFELPWFQATPGCEIRLGDWYVLPKLDYYPLTVTMTAPPTVRRGTTLEYEVILLDSNGIGVRLEPCPVFEQTLAGVGTARWHRLNCVVRTLPKHQPVRYAMRLSVPADAPLGPTKLEWWLVLGTGESAIAELGTGGVRVEIVD